MLIPPLEELTNQAKVTGQTIPGGAEDGSTGQLGAQIKPSEISSFASYLEHPTREGYWRLSAKWERNGRFPQYVYDKIKTRLFAESITPNDKNAKPKPKYTDAQRKEIVDVITRRISSLFSLCYWARSSRNDADLPAEKWGESKILADFLQDLNPDTLRSDFPTLLSIFEGDIFCDEFCVQVFANTPCRFKHGLFFILKSPRTVDEVVVVSTDRRPLDVIMKFLLEAGLISLPSVERIFSPEDEVFAPYFVFLSYTFRNIVNDERLRPQFKSAFDYFGKNDFVHCIGTLGLAAEDYLTQVYEYYFRSSCPKGMTLGQIYDLIHSEMRTLTKPPPKELRDVKKLYEIAKEIEAVDISTSSTNLVKAIASLTREFVAVINSDRSHVSYSLGELKRKDVTVSMFPDRIKDNLTELIRNRNAAAHKTRVPIGNYEALRTLYCLTSFVMWWRTERQQTDWGRGMKEIVEDAISKIQ